MGAEKQELFLSEPMGDKPTDNLPGIDTKAAKALSEENFDFAYQLFGQLMLLKQDEVLFIEWLRTFGIKQKEAQLCYNCLKAWQDNFL